jgi:HK97 family phage major capsid protein
MKTHSQAVQRIKEIEGELSALADKPKLSRSESLRHVALIAEADECNEHRKKLERYQDIANGRGGSKIRIDDSDGIDPYADERGGDHRPNDPTRGHRDRAMRTIGDLVDADRLPARSAETVETLTRTGSMSEQGWAARMVEALGSDAYMSSFSKLVADPARGHLMWSAAEQSAFQRVEQLRSETRAMSTIDTQGGFAIPLTLDPTILISSAGSTNPLRAISRGVQTVTDSWNGISSASVQAEWLVEGGEAADASPTLAQPTIPVYKASAFVPFSYELSGDVVNFTAELSKLLTDGYLQLTNTAFTTGSGIGQPTGIITALAATSTSIVNTATNDILVSGDVYALQNALPPRFQANAQWCANLSTLNTLRQFETTAGALKFPSLQNDPPTLLGRNANELSNMTGAIVGGQNNQILVYGSFEEFVIVDRWPSQLELIQNLFGANRRPTGQRGAFLWARVGSDTVVPNAFRLLTA